MFCSVSDWQTGVGTDFLIDAAEITPEKIEELVGKGIL